MITLTRITEPVKLDEYHRFRYTIYNESRHKFFTASSDGVDKDPFDHRAYHFGWYVGGKLAGCIRFIEPDGSALPIPMLTMIDDEKVAQGVRSYIGERQRRGERMVEASRFCLAPRYRGLRTAREFVLAMLRAMYPLDVMHGLFDCDVSHGRFYSALGFETLQGCDRFDPRGAPYTACIKRYDLERMLAVNPELRESVGFTSGLIKKAA